METHSPLHRLGPSALTPVFLSPLLPRRGCKSAWARGAAEGAPSPCRLHSALPRPAFLLPGSRWQRDQRGLLPRPVYPGGLPSGHSAGRRLTATG